MNPIPPREDDGRVNEFSKLVGDDTSQYAAADAPTRVPGSGSRSGSRAPGGEATAAAGPLFEGYELQEEIHRGGQGVVYRALQLGTKREVALKVLLEGPFAGEMTRRRFEREIELAAALHHPNIVTILDSGLSLGRYYFVMEFIRGLRLDRYLAQKRPPLRDVLILFEKICAAVNFAHLRGVIHRDLKPPNILVDDDGEPRVLDFGLAKPTHRVTGDETTVQILSMSGQLIGTVGYMSPEQAAGSHDVDVRSDVYSLGVMLYEALVGQPPYPVEGPLGEVLQRIVNDDPIPPDVAVAQQHPPRKVDDEVATIALKALEKEPARRYQTAGDLARDIRRRLDGEPIEAKRASAIYLMGKMLRRYRLQAATAGLIFVMLVGFLITFASLFARERDARYEAVQKTEETRLAVERQQAALEEARQRTADARNAEQRLRQVLARERIRRGDLALERGDVSGAAESYWEAHDAAPGPATWWALRRFYVDHAAADAEILSPGARGPAALSPSGRFAAVAQPADFLTVFALDNAAPPRTVILPGECLAANVDDDGALAAAGADWARAWRPEAYAPAVAYALPADVVPQHVFVAAGGDALLLIDRTGAVHYARAPIGADAAVVRLQIPLGASAAFHSGTQRLALATQKNILVLAIDEGRLRRSLVRTPGDAPADLVYFDRGGQLCVVSDALYVESGSMQAPGLGGWSRWAPAPAGVTALDVDADAGDAVLATRRGEVVFATAGGAEPPRFVALESAFDARLQPGRDGALLIGDGGALARVSRTQRVDERRVLSETPFEVCAASADGSTALLADARGRVVRYAPRLDGAFETVVRPRMLARLRGRTTGEDIDLALDAFGRRGVVRDGATLRLFDFPAAATTTAAWADPRFTLPASLAISADGADVAVLARTAFGDAERITFLPWPAAHNGRIAPAGGIEIIGAVVRALGFIPGTHTLLVGRSNGQVLRLDADRASQNPTRDAPSDTWLQLDAAPTLMAFSRTGSLLALACTDNVVRVVDVAQRSVLYRLERVTNAVALAFNPRDDVLLVRSAEGRIQLYETSSGELVTQWDTTPEVDRAIAVWSGDGDAIIVGDATRTYEHRYAAVDDVVNRGRRLVRERQIGRAIERREYDAAWRLAEELEAADAARGLRAKREVVIAALQHASATVPEAWLAAVFRDADERVLLRAGNAAYDGERFELALRWLTTATNAVSAPDTTTLQNLAAAQYLAGRFDDAAATLARALAQPDTTSVQRPTLILEHVAALLLAGRSAEGRQAVAALAEPDRFGRAADFVGAASARVTARVLLGIEDVSLAVAALDELLTRLDPRTVLYKDDLPFFAGELARLRGDNEQAAALYQRCIDLARDPWPSNWARYRLANLAQPAAGRS